MNIIKKGSFCNITEKIKEIEKCLLTNRIYTFESINHEDHIAAYIAWSTVGGNLFIRAPMLPIEQKKSLDNDLEILEVSNSVLMHTGGTTGFPKIVIHTETQMQEICKINMQYMDWNINSRFLNFLPAFTSGFWNLVILSLIKTNSTVILGDRLTINDDLKLDVNLTSLVPAMIDQLTYRNISADLSKFNNIVVGSSPVLRRHVEYIFKNNAKIFNHVYGMTEVGVPLLLNNGMHVDDECEYLKFSALGNNKIKLINNELLVNGKSVCANYKKFDHTDEWFITKDLWEQKDNLIKYSGRSNDIIKLNGFTANLLFIEQLIEDKIGLGECVAIVRNTIGTDWIELFYTNEKANIDQIRINGVLSNFLPSCNIPKKYTYRKELSRGPLGKKIRNDY